MTEIEIKAHVYEPLAVEKTISQFAGEPRRLEKKDEYWAHPENGKRVRIRVETEFDSGGKTASVRKMIAYKRKELKDTVEINDEIEFAIDSQDDFQAFLSDLGFAPKDRKQKKTLSWTVAETGRPPITIELSEVEPIGWFVEIEILMENPGQESIARARESLMDTLARCGVSETELETRYYTDLLADSAKKM